MAADVQNAGHDADCPGNSTGGDMAAVADALCDCAQPAFVDAVAKPLPVALAAAPIVWTAPPLAYSGADFTRTPSFHGPPRLYLLTGRLRI